MESIQEEENFCTIDSLIEILENYINKKDCYEPLYKDCLYWIRNLIKNNENIDFLGK